MEEVMNNDCHSSLVGAHGNSQTKWHYRVAVYALWRLEGS